MGTDSRWIHWNMIEVWLTSYNFILYFLVPVCFDHWPSLFPFLSVLVFLNCILCIPNWFFAILGNCFICLGRKEVVDCWPVKNTGCEDHDIELWLFVILIVQFDLMIQINHWIVSWPKVWCWFFSWMRSLLTCCKFNLLWLSAMLVDDPNYLYILDEFSIWHPQHVLFPASILTYN